ncbi:MAG: DHA2 family efflux MFS transporter permease subunit [Thermodesulfobacteriota bacterium]|nr:DHA2 family efflux MFS transporter permease subunit [Thermodesulfobacteriota bacterium]
MAERYATGPLYKYAVAVIVTVGTFMALLDTNIVVICLPKIMASLNADIYGIQWVVISYLVAAAVTMPVIHWITELMGSKRVYLLGVAIFTIMSIICGQARNIETMVFSRIIQGVGEGLVVPIALIILNEVFPPEEKGLAMGIYGLGVAIGPALGPPVGAFLTDRFNWRWIFYINIPIGFTALIAAALIIKPTRRRKKKSPYFDYPGFITMAISIGAIIIALGKGQEKGWSSDYILSLLLIFFIFFPLFLLREYTAKEPLIKLSIFRNRNFVLAASVGFLWFASTIGSFFLLPIYMVNLKGYPTLLTGMIIFPHAIPGALAMLIGGRLCDRINPKIILGIGVIYFAFWSFSFSLFDLYSTKSQIFWYVTLWGPGFGLINAPVLAIAISSLGDNQERIQMGTGLLTILRLLGGCIGTSITTTVLERRIDYYFEALRVKITYTNVTAMQTFKKLIIYFQTRGSPEILAELKARSVLNLHTITKATSYAFSDAFFAAAIIIAIGIIPVFLLRFSKKSDAGDLTSS